MWVYGLCFTVGGVFVLLAAIGGLDGVDFASDFDLDLDTEVPADFDDVDFGTQADQVLAILRNRWWLPLLSLRFWTFALCFFGLTGLLINLVQPDLVGWLTAVIALAMGVVCGWVAAVVMRSLSRQSVSSLVKPEDLTGRMATVEIPFDFNSRGKVRLTVNNSTLSFLAMTQEEREFQAGDQVLVVGLERDKLWVASAEGVE